MSLIHVFTDHVRNRKSLAEYVEIRKQQNERGEFNDRTLLEAETYLQRLKKEEPEIYEKMYETLEEIYRRDEGHYVEYPITFVKQILRIYRNGIPAQNVCEAYRRVLEHHFQDA